MNSSTSMTPIIIPLSKAKLFMMLLGCLVMAAGSVWLWNTAPSQTRFSPIVVQVAAAVGVVLFGACGILMCFKFATGGPGLVIDEQGLVDQASGVAAGRIPWEEIIGLRISEVSSQRFLVIDVIDPQKYLNRGGLLRRALNKANASMVGSPICISSNTLKVDFDKLVRLVSQSFERHIRAKASEAREEERGEAGGTGGT